MTGGATGETAVNVRKAAVKGRMAVNPEAAVKGRMAVNPWAAVKGRMAVNPWAAAEGRTAAALLPAPGAGPGEEKIHEHGETSGARLRGSEGAALS